jgi:hypothetical protein
MTPYGYKGPAKAKRPPAGMEGVTYTVERGRTKTGWSRRRKPTLDELLATQEACERSQAASDEIRRNVFRYTEGQPPTRIGPVPTNFYREALARAILEAEAKPAPRKRKASPAVVGNGTVASPLEAIDAARRARDSADRALVTAAVDARAAGVGVSDIARRLKLTRQGAYKLLARA